MTAATAASRPARASAQYRPTWAEIDLSQLRANLRAFRRRLKPGVRVLGVVKADAYGHGAARVARALEDEKADWLGVSSVEEGVAARRAGVRLPVLVLGSLYPFESFDACAAFKLTPTIASLEGARRLVESAERRRYKLACHVKVETGMGRIGVSVAAAAAVLGLLSKSKRVRPEGLYSHLACAESDEAFTRGQLAAFKAAVDAARAAGVEVPLKHLANSQGALRYPESHWDMVRPGLALYGLMPPFEPVLSLKTRLVFLKRVPAGTRLGYGATFTTARPSSIATLPIGYADGVARGLSNRGEALVRGRRCRIVGAISMDMLMVDVTDVPAVAVGDEAVLIGGQGRGRIDASEPARALGTIPYEIATGLAARVPRRYLE